MMEVISASRRTDIPAFYADWFMERIRAGRVAYRNPFGGRRYEVSLLPGDVHSIVFWSKDFRPLLPHLEELDRRGFYPYFHFTITGLPRLFEPRVCPKPTAVRTFRQLATRYSPAHLQWRYDPILISTASDCFHHIRAFTTLCQGLRGYTRRCYLSFARMYRKTDRNLRQLGPRVNCTALALAQQRWLVGCLARIAGEREISVYACGADHLVQGRIQKARCVDGEVLSKLFPGRPSVTEARPTRAGCGCTASRDIGAYDTCAHGCLYCYATESHRFAPARTRTVDRLCEELGRPALF